MWLSLDGLSRQRRICVDELYNTAPEYSARDTRLICFDVETDEVLSTNKPAEKLNMTIACACAIDDLESTLERLDKHMDDLESVDGPSTSTPSQMNQVVDRQFVATRITPIVHEVGFDEDENRMRLIHGKVLDNQNDDGGTRWYATDLSYLLHQFDNADIIVAYNSHFDFTVIKKYYNDEERYNKHLEKVFDPCVVLKKLYHTNNAHLSLNEILKANCDTKLFDEGGIIAPLLWKGKHSGLNLEHQLHQLVRYCFQDVLGLMRLILLERILVKLRDGTYQETTLCNVSSCKDKIVLRNLIPLSWRKRKADFNEPDGRKLHQKSEARFYLRKTKITASDAGLYLQVCNGLYDIPGAANDARTKIVKLALAMLEKAGNINPQQIDKLKALIPLQITTQEDTSFVLKNGNLFEAVALTLYEQMYDVVLDNTRGIYVNDIFAASPDAFMIEPYVLYNIRTNVYTTKKICEVKTGTNTLPVLTPRYLIQIIMQIVCCDDKDSLIFIALCTKKK